MKITVPFEVVKDRNPDAVDAVISVLRKSSSKHRDAAPEDLEWGYRWCVQVRSLSLMDVFAGEQERASEPNSVEEMLEKSMKGVSVCVEAVKGRWSGSSPYESDSDLWSPEFLEYYRDQAEKQFAEKKRVDSLTDKERDAEVEALLGQLRGTPGFMEIKI